MVAKMRFYFEGVITIFGHTQRNAQSSKADPTAAADESRWRESSNQLVTNTRIKDSFWPTYTKLEGKKGIQRSSKRQFIFNKLKKETALAQKSLRKSILGFFK